MIRTRHQPISFLPSPSSFASSSPRNASTFHATGIIDLTGRGDAPPSCRVLGVYGYPHAQHIRPNTTHLGKAWRIHCPFGPKRVPTDDEYATFRDIVLQYNNNNNTPQTICVHCYSGKNRTAYAVCRFLVEEWEIPPKDAIARFVRARRLVPDQYILDAIMLL
jgi:hypothetical protein